MKILKHKFIYVDLISIAIFTSIIFFFGINDIEEYQLGLFSAQIYWTNWSALFTVFYDFYGAGTKMPLGHGPLFHPLNILLFDLKTYYVFFYTLHLFLQIYFTKRIFKIFQIKYEYFILVVSLVFSLPNILYGISEDWLSVMYGYCMFPVVFYYLVKIINTQKILSYLKFALLFFLWLINGHIGNISVYLIFFLIYTLFSIKSYQHFKKIFNFSLITSLIFLGVMLSDYVYYMLREMAYFDSTAIKSFQSAYSKRHFVEIFYPFEKFLSWMPINRLPGNPILIFFCISISLCTAYKSLSIFVKNYNNEKNKTFFYNAASFLFKQIQTNYSFKFSFLFGIFIIFSTTNILKYTYILSGSWLSRDIFLYIGLFLYFLNYENFGVQVKKLLNFFLIFYTLLFFVINVHSIYIKNENNFIVDRFQESELITKLKKLDIQKNDHKRIYLSPELYSEIRHGYEKDGIFAVTDLIKFNLSPFNGWFKNTSMSGFGDDRSVMHGWIDSHFIYINNEFFLNIYKINYLLIKEKELKDLNNSNFKIKEIIKSEKGNLYLFERQVLNYSIQDQYLNIFINNLAKCNKIKIQCLLENKNLFIQSDYSLRRHDNGKFFIDNVKNNELIFLPFVYDLNWHSADGTLYGVDNFIMLFRKESTNSSGAIQIEYMDKLRIFFKMLSISSFLILLLIIIYISRKSKII
jgi:hypothetical protein